MTVSRYKIDMETILIIIMISEDLFGHDIVEVFSSDFFAIGTGSLQHLL